MFTPIPERRRRPSRVATAVAAALVAGAIAIVSRSIHRESAPIAPAPQALEAPAAQNLPTPTPASAPQTRPAPLPQPEAVGYQQAPLEGGGDLSPVAAGQPQAQTRTLNAAPAIGRIIGEIQNVIGKVVGVGVQQQTGTGAAGCQHTRVRVDRKSRMTGYSGSAPDYDPCPGAGPQYGAAPTYGQAPTYGLAPTYGQAPKYGKAPQYGKAAAYSSKAAGYGSQTPGYSDPAVGYSR